MKFSKSSEDKLMTCHIDLQKIMRLALQRSNVDFGISEGHRPLSIQQGYYAIGRTVDKHKSTITNVDGVKTKGKHNHVPSEAVDIFVANSNSSMQKKTMYDEAHLSYIAGIVDSCAKELLAKREITHKVRWGGNWNSDGVIKFDQKLNDMPHFEIIK